MSRPESRPGTLLRLLQLVVVLSALVRRRPAPRLPRGVDAEDLAAGYEHSDLSPVVVGLGAIALLVSLGLVLVGVTLFEQAVVAIPVTIGRPAELTAGLQAAPAPTPPAPALEARSGQTLDPYRELELRKLNSYGWVDRSAGVVRIPIDRAMDLTAQRGLPARPMPSATPASPSVASSGRMDEAYP